MDATEVDLSGSDLDNVSSVDRPIVSEVLYIQYDPYNSNPYFHSNVLKQDRKNIEKMNKEVGMLLLPKKDLIQVE